MSQRATSQRSDARTAAAAAIFALLSAGCWPGQAQGTSPEAGTETRASSGEAVPPGSVAATRACGAQWQARVVNPHWTGMAWLPAAQRMLVWGSDGTVWHLNPASKADQHAALRSDTNTNTNAARADNRGAAPRWQPSLLDHAGRIRLVQSTEGDTNTASVAVGDDGLLFQSADQGLHWQAATFNAAAQEAVTPPADSTAPPRAASWRALAHQGRGTERTGQNQRDTWLAASSEGLLARSHDGGQQWQAVRSWVAGRGVRALAPASQGEWLIVDGQGTLWRSAQDASDWRSIPGVKPLQRLSRFADPQPEWLASSSEGLLLRSTDGGRRWQQVADLKAPVLGIQALPGTPGGRVAFGGAGQCRMRPTRSAPWRDCHLPEPGVVQSLTMDSRAGRWLASGEAGLLWTSIDQGRHWQRVALPAQVDVSRMLDAAAWDPSRERFWVGGEGGLLMLGDRHAQHWQVVHDAPREYVHDLAAVGAPSSGSGLLASLSHRRLARSDDGGLSWRSHLFSQLLEPAYLFSVNVNADGGVVVGGGQGSVLVAPDGQHWLAHSSGTGSAFLNALMLPDQRTVLLFGSGGVLARVDSMTGDREDLPLPMDTPFYGGFVDARHGAVYLVGTSGWVLRSADDGQSWRGFQVGDRTLDAGGVSPDGRSLIVAGRQGAAYRSVLDAQGQPQDWDTIQVPTDPEAPEKAPGWRFVQSDAAGRAWWLGNNQGRLLRSTDQGEHWEWVQTGWNATLRPPVYDATHGRWWMPARSGGLLCSNDDGRSWTPVFSHTTEHLRGVWIDPTQGALLAYGGRLVRLDPTATGPEMAAANPPIAHNATRLGDTP